MRCLCEDQVSLIALNQQVSVGDDQRAASQASVFPFHFARFEFHAGQMNNSPEVRVAVETVQVPFKQDAVVEVVPHVSMSVLLLQPVVGQSEHHTADVVPCGNKDSIFYDDGRC